MSNVVSLFPSCSDTESELRQSLNWMNILDKDIFFIELLFNDLNSVCSEFYENSTFFSSASKDSIKYKVCTIWNEKFVWKNISREDFETICENIIENIECLAYTIFHFNKTYPIVWFVINDFKGSIEVTLNAQSKK